MIDEEEEALLVQKMQEGANTQSAAAAMANEYEGDSKVVSAAEA